MSASSSPGLLLIGSLQHTQQERERLRTKDRNEFLQYCEQGKFGHVVGLYRPNATKETGPFDEELVLSLPASLKYIGLNGAGYDGMDISACTERNIRISNTPNIVANATADVAMFLLLGALRHAMIPLQALRDGRWKEGAPLGHDPYGKTLGILGMGAIGQVNFSNGRRRLLAQWYKDQGWGSNRRANETILRQQATLVYCHLDCFWGRLCCDTLRSAHAGKFRGIRQMGTLGSMGE
ncbi:hypothetical protein SI65_09518 [Aspergillus cristatus]|uniref:D-isomer specific 2-hydroxyacid dehydrogenase catalytic domain-containing protein n=1 Tax=Aspergillus cristatus TaxID=573508 RepID=A0A1E3B248_ASPCR|nr:hypothetical protein SI65_09518 [Aspergillus cristatus]